MAEQRISPKALIAEGAQIAEGVEIGPYAVIGEKVKVGQGTKIGSHACIDGHTVIGEENLIGRHACIGADPQDKGYKGEETYLVVGDRNFFGDFSQVCRGTLKSDDRATRIGDDNFIMSYTHIAHDCVLSNHITIASYAAVAGHVEIEDHVYIGGHVALHQFIKLGCHSMIAGASAAGNDIPPFIRVAGYGCNVSGLNKVGMKRLGNFSNQELQNLKEVYRLFFEEGGPQEQILAELRKRYPEDKHVKHFCHFIETSKRGINRRRFTKRLDAAES